MAKLDTTTSNVPSSSGSGSSRSCATTLTRGLSEKRARSRSSMVGEKSNATASAGVQALTTIDSSLPSPLPRSSTRPGCGGSIPGAPLHPPIDEELCRRDRGTGLRALRCSTDSRHRPWCRVWNPPALEVKVIDPSTIITSAYSWFVRRPRSAPVQLGVGRSSWRPCCPCRRRRSPRSGSETRP